VHNKHINHRMYISMKCILLTHLKPDNIIFTSRFTRIGRWLKQKKHRQRINYEREKKYIGTFTLPRR